MNQIMMHEFGETNFHKDRHLLNLLPFFDDIKKGSRKKNNHCCSERLRF